MISLIFSLIYIFLCFLFPLSNLFACYAAVLVFYRFIILGEVYIW